MGLEYRRCDAESRQPFDAWVRAYPTGDLLQGWAWGDLKAEGGWKPYRFAAVRDGQICAAVSVLQRGIPRTGRSIWYSPRGPVLALQDRTLADGFLRYVADEARRAGAILWKIDPPIKADDAAAVASVCANGFRPVAAGGFGGTQPRCVMQLDLAGRTESDVIESFKPKWRYNIRLAERKGVTCRTSEEPADLARFYQLLLETARRDRFLVRSQSYYEAMWRLLAPDQAIRLYLTEYEGETLSGALMYVWGDRAWYTYGASSNSHRNLMPNHLMQWRMIQDAMALGCKWYDFRGVSPQKDASDEHLRGLNRFKEGFNPRFVEYIGEYDLVLSPMWYWIWTVAAPRVQRAMRGKARQAAAE